VSRRFLDLRGGRGRHVRPFRATVRLCGCAAQMPLTAACDLGRTCQAHSCGCAAVLHKCL
jgi:hypothetical protein